MRKNTLLLICLLVFSPLVSLAQEGFALFTTDFPPEEFAARRAALYDVIGSSAIAVLQGAPGPAGYVRFRQSNEFYYLSGIEIPHSYLLLDGSTRRATLYLPHRNEGRERSEGKTLIPEEAVTVKQLSGIDAVYGIDLLPEHLARYARGNTLRTLFTPFSPAEGFAMSRDLAVRSVGDAAADPFDGRASREGNFIQLLRLRFPQFEIRDLTPPLDNLRLIKSPREIALMKKATQLSGLALMECMRSTKPGIMEYELDAVAKYVYYRNGAQGEAYFSLIQSGPNAMVGHYNANKRKMQDGDFLLMDFAPDYGYYMSDLTRTWPVNGTFSTHQRELYEFYVGCYRSVLKAIRPGATAQAILLDAVREMDGILSKTAFSKPVYEAAAKRFVGTFRSSSQNPRAMLGHWVGMSTHDVGQDYGPLRAGMVFTIEPAFTIPEESISIRCEDLIVITDRGAEVVSDFVPLDMAGIEKLMRGNGMLQQYPRAHAVDK
ncbi:MAG: Xaa-Pro peptidase family protein [Ignavibacteriales bacterium]|nr:Xaa-Pro peptidase family protein [Ignavibacteriales bacterium]